MRMRSGKSWTSEEFTRTVVVKPALTWFETCDNRVMRRGVVLRGVLVRRTIAAANMTTLGASAKMKPPPSRCQTLDATSAAGLGRQVDAVSVRIHGASRLSPATPAKGKVSYALQRAHCGFGVRQQLPLPRPPQRAWSSLLAHRRWRKRRADWFQAVELVGCYR
jgi:hypothetical protein